MKKIIFTILVILLVVGSFFIGKNFDKNDMGKNNNSNKTTTEEDNSLSRNTYNYDLSKRKNVQILSNDISNIEKETIILAAHSGSGYKAFFKDLDKLELGNEAHMYYNNKKFNYIVSDIYIEKKDGNIEVPASHNLLLLTTCYGKDRQLIIILEKDYGFVS